MASSIRKQRVVITTPLTAPQESGLLWLLDGSGRRPKGATRKGLSKRGLISARRSCIQIGSRVHWRMELTSKGIRVARGL